MALIDEQPPTTLPRAHSTPRPPIESSGSQKYIQSCRRLSRSRGQPSGMWIHGSRSHPPARLEKQVFSSLTPAQPVGQRAAGRAGADDDVVVALDTRHEDFTRSEGETLRFLPAQQPAELFPCLAHDLGARSVAGWKKFG